MYDDLEAEFFSKNTLLIYVNSLQNSGSETLQKTFYSENSAMTQFRMIREPYLAQAISLKV